MHIGLMDKIVVVLKRTVFVFDSVDWLAVIIILRIALLCGAVSATSM